MQKLFSYKLLLLTCCMYGCGNRMSPSGTLAGQMAYDSTITLTPAEFIRWSNTDDGLRCERKAQDLVFSVTYHPSERMAMKAMGNSATPASIIEEVSNHYSDLLYFNLRIELTGKPGEPLKYNLGSNSYSGRVEYYSFKVQNDIKLVATAGDTIPCCIAHFERAFNTTNHCDILLGFSKKDLKDTGSSQSILVLVTDPVFTHNQLKFSFEKKRIINTPKIKV